MRRIFGVVLIGVAVFGLVFAGVERFWAYPNGEKTPLDLDIPIIATGPAQVFNAEPPRTARQHRRSTT